MDYIDGIIFEFVLVTANGIKIGIIERTYMGSLTCLPKRTINITIDG